MKKILLAPQGPLVVLLSILIVATTAFAVTDYLIKSPSGNLILDAATGYVVKINKTLQVDNIKNLAGTSSPPGMVPIGGMVAVMPTTHANAWQPPATGAIKDGFMRADGGTVPTCSDCIIPAGTVLPNMVTKYPRGNTTSGTTGGANTVTLAASQIPQMSGAFTSGTESADHAHYTSGTTSGQSVNHTHGVAPGGGPYYVAGGGTYGVPGWNVGSTTGGYSADHTHTWGNWSGGKNATHTHATTVTLGAASPASVNNEPAYVEVVWVMRVK